MHRRSVLWAAASSLGAAFAASRAGAATETLPTAKLKVVYHLSDLDKVSFVVGNGRQYPEPSRRCRRPRQCHDRAGRPRPGTAGLPCVPGKPRPFQARRSILQGRSRTRRLRQHDEVPKGRPRRSAAGLRCRRPRRRGPDRRIAIAGLSLPAAVIAAQRALSSQNRARVSRFTGHIPGGSNRCGGRYP